jgi:hypothetical protein
MVKVYGPQARRYKLSVFRGGPPGQPEFLIELRDSPKLKISVYTYVFYLLITIKPFCEPQNLYKIAI